MKWLRPNLLECETVTLTDAQVISLGTRLERNSKRIAELTAALQRVVDCYDLDGDCLRSGDLENCRRVLANGWPPNPTLADAEPARSLVDGFAVSSDADCERRKGERRG